MVQLTLLERILDWIHRKIASCIPETSKRYVLYELQDRVCNKILERPPIEPGGLYTDVTGNIVITESTRNFDGSDITFDELYMTLKD